MNTKTTTTATTNEITLTPASLKLFTDLVKDAPNWNGCPLVYLNRAERGNLTDLKRMGLLETEDDGDGNIFAYFTKKGSTHAVAIGLEDPYRFRLD